MNKQGTRIGAIAIDLRCVLSIILLDATKIDTSFQFTTFVYYSFGDHGKTIYISLALYSPICGVNALHSTSNIETQNESIDRNDIDLCFIVSIPFFHNFIITHILILN